MKKNLLVTFADKNYIDQAKQLFASAHFKGGWDGDFMLISPDITDEQKSWFDKKGIIVKKYPNPVKSINLKNFPGTLYAIFYLFTEEFKKWSHIIYLDVDVLVRDNFSELLKVKTFAASEDILRRKLKKQFGKKHVKYNDYSPSKHLGITTPEYRSKVARLRKRYNLNVRMFNAGIFVLNTEVIKSDTFDQLINLADEFGRISQAPPQGEINLLFYDKWERLPFIYNIYPHYWNKGYRFNQEDIDGVFLHFCASTKPWHKDSYYYKEWKESLDEADKIDINSPIRVDKKWKSEEILILEKKIKRIHLTLKISLVLQRILGEGGLVLQKISPKLFTRLKKLIRLIEKKFTRRYV